MGYADTDVAEFVFKTRPSADSLVKFLCHDLSEACSAETPPVPKVMVFMYQQEFLIYFYFLWRNIVF